MAGALSGAFLSAERDADERSEDDTENVDELDIREEESPEQDYLEERPDQTPKEEVASDVDDLLVGSTLLPAAAAACFVCFKCSH